MKADLIALDAARADRRASAAGDALRAAGTMLLVGASLVLIAGGIVAAALWFVWRLAEIVP